MENFSIHLRGVPRLFPSALPVTTIGLIRAKNNWVNNLFSTMNFSLILAGGGEYRRHGKLFYVESPCVITQWPAERAEYGPCRGFANWDELYLVYQPGSLRSLQKCRFAVSERPVWPIRDPSPVFAMVSDLTGMISRCHEKGVADRIDRLCEEILLETLIGDIRPAAGDADERNIERIRSLLEKNYAKPLDIHQVAAQHGFSPSTFRRKWEKRMAVPPAAYIAGLRIRDACSLLSRTRLPVHVIARRIGFEDELYFSRKFSEKVGMSATAYRRMHGHSYLAADSILDGTGD